MIDSATAKTGERGWQLARRASMSQRLLRLYGFVQTLPVFGPIARSVVAYALPPETRVWVQLRAGHAHGLWLNLDPRFERMYAQGLYEPTIQNLLVEKLSAGGTFYDVGGHIGFISLIAARLVGDAGAVYTFEADPGNAARINQQVLRNDLKQISVIPMAAWSRSGTLRFQRAAERSSHNQGAVLGSGAEASGADTIEVSAVSLDEFVEDHRTPTLVKLDVEGGEIEVLQGAERIFSNARPTLICEIHNQKALEFTVSYLATKQYSLQWLSQGSGFPRHVLAEPSMMLA